MTPDRQDRPREPNPASLRKRFLRQPRTLDLPRPTASGRQGPADVGRGVVQSCRKLFLSNPPSSSRIDFSLFLLLIVNEMVLLKMLNLGLS